MEKKRGILRVLAVTLFLSGSAGGASSVTVLSPDQGANWEKGRTYRIDFFTQECAGYCADFQLRSVSSPGIGYELFNSPPLIDHDGSNSVTYTVEDHVPLDRYNILIVVYRRVAPSDLRFITLDYSSLPVTVIEALPSHITVTNPDTWGLKWAQGSTQTITWTTTGDPVSNVRIELLKGLTYQHLSDNAPNTGSLTWNIPADQEVRSDCMIGITSVSDSRIYGYSNVFAVVPQGEASIVTVDGYKDALYSQFTGPENGYLRIPSCACNDNGRPVDNADLSAEIWAAWDTDYLYLYEEVMDDTVSGSSANRWEEDCLELYVDPSPTDASVNSVWSGRLTALQITTPGVMADDNINTVPDLSKQIARRIIPGGYALELKVRWSAITANGEGVNLTEGRVFGFAIQQHDNDGRGRRQASVEWAAVMLNAVYNTPAYLGTATLLSGNRLKLEAKNNITGTVNPIPYNSSVCSDMLCDIDGNMDGTYLNLTGPSDGYLQLRYYDYNDNGAPVNDADLSAKIWTAWDADWLYLYEEVRDDTLGANATNVWEEDCIELKIDPQPTSATNSIFAAALTALDKTTPGVIKEDNLSGIAADSKYYYRKTTPGGYSLEMAVKWSAIVSGSEQITPAVGNVFGLAINQHDNDLRGRRQATVQWAAVLKDAVWNTPSYLGTVKFLSGNKLQFTARNNITGTTNPVPYDGSDYNRTGVEQREEMPSAFTLAQNYPNPFNPSTEIQYVVSEPGNVTLAVYNVLGQRVRVLRDGRCQAGSYTAEWDGLDERGLEAGSGIYVAVLTAGKTTVSRKMVKVE